jgi:hypothetical protein
MLARGSNTRIWHMPSWVGDYPTSGGESDSFGAAHRDALQGSTANFETSRFAHINCEGRFAMDETVQFWYDTFGIAWLRGAIFDPLHTPPDFVIPGDDHHGPGIDHGYGQIINGRSDVVMSQQSLYAHTTDRNPLVAAANYAHINNLHYNHGRVGGGSGAGVKIDDNGEHNEVIGKIMRANLVGNVTVRGPEQGDKIVFAEIQDVTEGSGGHGAFNSQFGWEPPASQADFFKFNATDATAESYLKPMLQRLAWPLGFGFDYDGVLRPAANPLAPTMQEGLAFVDLIRNTVGCMPARRYLYKGGISKVCDQIEAAIRGIPSGPQYVNTVAEAGGWPQMPIHTITDLTQNEWWHAPFPVGADRDDVYDSGTLVDGSSRVGLNKIREWIINQYHYVTGR